MLSPVVPPRPTDDDSGSTNSTFLTPSMSTMSLGTSTPGSTFGSQTPLSLSPSLRGGSLVPYSSAAPPPPSTTMQGYQQHQPSYFPQYQAAVPVMQTMQYVQVPQYQPGFATTPILHPQQGLPGMMTTQMQAVPLPVAVQPAMSAFQQGPSYHLRPAGRAEQMPTLSKWSAGLDYGPVHDARMATLLSTTFEVNPILRTLPPQSDENRLEYNLLFSLSTASLFKDKEEISWVDGRDEPAVLPRLETLTLISEHFPWMIHVKARDADVGVTCVDVMEALYKNLHKNFSREEVNRWSKARLEKISAVYHHNRQAKEGVPGGALGKGFRRVDYLSEYTLFDGIEYDEAMATERFGFTPTQNNNAPKGKLGLRSRRIQGVFKVRFAHNNAGKDIHAPRLAKDWRFPDGEPSRVPGAGAPAAVMAGPTHMPMPHMGQPSPMMMHMGLPPAQPVYQAPHFPAPQLQPQPQYFLNTQDPYAQHQQPQYFTTPAPAGNQLPMQGAPMPVGYALNPTAPVQAYAPVQIPMSPQQPVIPNQKRKNPGGLFGWKQS